MTAARARQLRSVIAFGLGAIAFGVGTAGSAGATRIVGYTLTLREGSLIELRNDSSSLGITRLEFTVGDTRFFFDEVRDFDPYVDGGSPLDTIVQFPSPNVQADLMSATDDFFQLAFDGFEPGDELRFGADVDLDGTNSFVPDFAAYFDNGPAPNSEFEVTFANGQALAFTYPEQPEIVDGRVVVSESARVIPEPSAALLFAIGAIVVGRATRRPQPRP